MWSVLIMMFLCCNKTLLVFKLPIAGMVVMVLPLNWFPLFISRLYLQLSVGCPWLLNSTLVMPSVVFLLAIFVSAIFL